MAEDQIKWPFGFSDNKVPFGWLGREGLAAIHPAKELVAALNAMEPDERTEFMTWLRQMLDCYGGDSATAITQEDIATG